MSAVPDDHEFALLLTHDVDRPYKTFQSLYYALRDRDTSHLRTAVAGQNPFWTFESVRAIEAELGVRSAFYFLDEQSLTDLPVREWVQPSNWRLFLGRYSLTDPHIVDLIRALEEGGWEIGLHGSFYSYRDRDLLEREKHRLSSIVDGELKGVRQHYLNLQAPETWNHQRSIGLEYDATPGSSDTYGFDDEYGIRRPFDDDFVVFPLTVMESSLPDPSDSFDHAWDELDSLLREAAANDAVMSVLWHPRFFSTTDFPGHRRLYRKLVETALDMGAWVGPPGELYDRLDHPTGQRTLAERVDVSLESTVGGNDR
jgi:hypothetical protein